MATKSSNVLTTVIKGSVWARGEKAPERNRLINPNGTMCCLGIDAVARGVSRQMIANAELPSEIDQGFGEVPDLVSGWSKDLGDLADTIQIDNLDGGVLDGDNGLDHAAACVNDDKKTTDDEKIAKLRVLFAAVNPPRRIVWLPNQ